MKITEVQHHGEPYWLHWLGNATAIDDKYVKSIGIAWLFKEAGTRAAPTLEGLTAELPALVWPE